MNHSRIWTLVLAAGDGSRLSSLTTLANGQKVPKQFCSLHGGASLLEAALMRAGAVSTRSRTVTVVAAHHRRWWERSLRNLPPDNVIVQPENRGTAAGLLLPLLHIMQRDPEATVLVLPSDHFFLDEATLAQSLRRVGKLAQDAGDAVYMLGLEPVDADPELGYILPAARATAIPAAVLRFVEKPRTEEARGLIASGALLNMFILAAPARALVALFAVRQPGLLGRIRTAAACDRHAPQAAAAAIPLYPQLQTLDFSRDVLEGQESGLRVLTAPPCGWTDLGTPRRVVETLTRLALPARTDAADGGGWLSLAEQHRRQVDSPHFFAHA